jgi:hypothetical protein
VRRIRKVFGSATTGSLNTARGGATTTLLSNGKVLIVGGSDNHGPLASAELYDPEQGTFAFTSDGTVNTNLNTARGGQRATVRYPIFDNREGGSVRP